MINFNEPVYLEKSMEYVKKAILVNKRLNGDGEFTGKCSEWMENRFGAKKIMLTTSCTHGLETVSYTHLDVYKRQGNKQLRSCGMLYH